MPAQKHGHRLFGRCNEPFFANRLCICFVACRTIPLQKSAAKACFSAERIVIGLLWASVTYGLALLAVRSVRSTKKNRFELQFQGLSTEDIELSVSDSRICADLISNAERKMNSLTGGGNSSP